MVINKYEPSKVTVKAPIVEKKKLEKNNKPEKVTIITLNKSLKALEIVNDINTKTIMNKIDSMSEKTRSDIANDISKLKNYIMIGIVSIFIFSLGAFVVSILAL